MGKFCTLEDDIFSPPFPSSSSPSPSRVGRKKKEEEEGFFATAMREGGREGRRGREQKWGMAGWLTGGEGGGSLGRELVWGEKEEEEEEEEETARFA